MIVSLPLLLLLLSPTLARRRVKIKDVRCTPLPFVRLENGAITTLSDQKFKLTCNKGYTLTGSSIVRCWRGNWTYTTLPRCYRSEGQCDPPEPIPNGHIYGEDTETGAIVQYMCNDGYVLVGEGKRTCQRSGYWGGVTPACMDLDEPLQNIAERFRKYFILDMGSYSDDSVARGRFLDRESLLKGLEIVILIDRSSSVDPVDFEIGKDFIKFLFQEFGVRNSINNTVGTKAAVIAFGTQVDTVFNVDNATIDSPEAASKALDGLQAGGGGTALEAALTAIFLRVLPHLRPNAKRALFLITDGEPNIGSPDITPEDLANQVKDVGKFEIFAVGIGKGINKKLLSGIASEPVMSHVFILDKYTDLDNIMKIIKDRPPEEPPISPDKCGFIQNGDIEKPKNWPWLVAIYVSIPVNPIMPRKAEDLRDNSTHNADNQVTLSLCSGTLICSQYVLTAASCFYFTHKRNVQMNIQEVFVVVGENDLLNEDKDQMSYYAEDIFTHENFKPLEDLQNNLAIIKLNKAVPVERFRPICLPPTDRTVPLHMDLNINTTIAGWGIPQENVYSRDINGGTVQFELSVKSVDLEDDNECAQLSGNSARDNIFCAGSGVNTCVGDLGSPIIASDGPKGYYHVLGVLSRRNRCHRGFSQYVEITKYITWINRVTKNCHVKHYIP